MESTEPITVDVVGDATYELDPDDLIDDPTDGTTNDTTDDTTASTTDDPADGPTYGDVIRAVGLSRHEATALVDGRPVPEDAPIAPGERVEVLRLIQGGQVRRRSPER